MHATDLLAVILKIKYTFSEQNRVADALAKEGKKKKLFGNPVILAVLSMFVSIAFLLKDKLQKNISNAINTWGNKCLNICNFAIYIYIYTGFCKNPIKIFFVRSKLNFCKNLYFTLS